MIWKFTLISKVKAGRQVHYATNDDVNFKSPNSISLPHQTTDHGIIPGMQIDVNGKTYDITSVSYSATLSNIYFTVSQTVTDQYVFKTDYVFYVFINNLSITRYYTCTQ